MLILLSTIDNDNGALDSRVRTLTFLAARSSEGQGALTLFGCSHVFGACFFSHLSSHPKRASTRTFVGKSDTGVAWAQQNGPEAPEPRSKGVAESEGAAESGRRVINRRVTCISGLARRLRTKSCTPELTKASMNWRMLTFLHWPKAQMDGP